MKKLILMLLALSGVCVLESSQGLPSKKSLSVCQDALKNLTSRAEQTQSDAVVILHDGKVVTEYYRDAKPKMIHAMSVTKSVVNLAYGLMYTQGLLDTIDKPVHHFYPEWNQSPKKNITIRHLLNHTSGLQDEQSALAVYQSSDFEQFALQADVRHEPGTHFFYSNKAVNILPGIVKKITGKPLDEYLNINLFAPLGIESYTWDHDDAGKVHGLAGLHIYPKDLAKIGQLILQNGTWNGKTVIVPEWFKISFAPTHLKPNSGLLWWLIPQSTTHIIDDEQINKLRQAGVQEKFIKKILPLKGSYTSDEAYEQKIEELFGKDYMTIFYQELKEGAELSRKVYGPVVGYKGWGYLGQYLIIYPEKNLVGVRMISSDTHGENGTTNDFLDFDTMLGHIVQ